MTTRPDELTNKINATLDNMKAHPADWSQTFKCRECGKVWTVLCNKTEVTNTIVTTCAKCSPKEDGDED